MDSEKQARLEAKIHEIIKAAGFSTDIKEVFIKSPGLKGEGFASLTKYVTVKFEDETTLDLFVKMKTENPSHNKLVEEMKAFEKESMFLTQFVPAAQQLCESKGLPNLLDFYPKCYYGDEEICVLENLVLGKGYSTVDKGAKQGLEFATVAVETLAKHNSIGHAMIEAAGGPEKFFQEYPELNHEWYTQPMAIGLMVDIFENALRSNLAILQANMDVEGVEKTAERIQNLMGKSKQLIIKAIEREDPGQCNVLAHGDYWNCNMMFRRDPSPHGNAPLHTMLIDFQTTRYNTPALDLGYFLWTSVPLAVRQSHLEELLKAYVAMLNKTTSELGHPVNLTYGEILLDYRRKVDYGFWNGFMAVVGPGLKMFDDVDVNTVDVSDWTEIPNKAMLKWIEENPEGAKEAAAELVSFIREYDDLRLD